MRKADILIAYPYTDAKVLDALRAYDGRVNWLLDSGAFTAWKSGNPIALDDYCRFLDGLPVKPWRYFALDVVGNPDATMANYREMRRRGFHPVPVFTQGAPVEHLEEYYAGSDLVAFGGIAAKNSQTTRNYIGLVMQRARGRNVHLLGFGNLEWLKVFKPFSCDSTGWNNGTMYGWLRLYMGKGRIEIFGREDMTAKPRRDVLDRLRLMGFDIRGLQHEANWRGLGGMVQQVNIASYVMLQQDMNTALGTRYFFACGSSTDLGQVMAQFDRLGGKP